MKTCSVCCKPIKSGFIVCNNCNKILDILKEKKPSILLIKKVKNYAEYRTRALSHYMLEEDEFDILKEWVDSEA